MKLRVPIRGTISAVALAAMLLSGCTSGGADAPAPDPTSSPPQATIDWENRPQSTVALDGGFGVKACPGDAPFLCVERDGTVVGQIEYFSFEEPAGGGEDTLRNHVDEDYNTFRSDREGCSEGFEVETVEPETAQVAGEEGLRSEYSVVNADGDTVERYVKYWALSDGRVHLLAAEAQEEGTCSPSEGTPFTAGGLEEFESSFEVLAERSRFPAGG
ncbi:MAG TPA: hypothetical protein VHJ78_13910 [Actinomycetota bacterium]|nr:hypothetical protein [Actinomycetota bacterium]